MFDTQVVFLKDFMKKLILKKFSRRQKSMKNYQGGKKLTPKSLNATASYLFNSGSIFKLTFTCFSPVYLETLTLIHQQVVMATEDQILDFFQYYLQSYMFLFQSSVSRDTHINTSAGCHGNRRPDT